jgi:hypothetical protein
MRNTSELKIQLLKKVFRNLKKVNYTPVLVGGQALILFGSQRATFDTDMVIPDVTDLKGAKLLTNAMREAGFCYVSKLDDNGIPADWIASPNVAAARITIDKPASIFFWKPDSKMKIDILLDFPLKTSELLATAINIPLDETTIIKVASLKSLKRMKEIAVEKRKKSTDVQDLDFIKKRMKSKKKSIEL